MLDASYFDHTACLLFRLLSIGRRFAFPPTGVAAPGVSGVFRAGEFRGRRARLDNKSESIRDEPPPSSTVTSSGNFHGDPIVMRMSLALVFAILGFHGSLLLAQDDGEIGDGTDFSLEEILVENLLINSRSTTPSGLGNSRTVSTWLPAPLPRWPERPWDRLPALPACQQLL